MEPKRPLQFSLRFALGVQAAVAVLCAASKTMGESFWMLLMFMLLVLTLLPTGLTVFSLVDLIGTVLLPRERNKETPSIPTLCRVFIGFLLWCVCSWFLLFLVGGVFLPRVL